MSLKFAAIGNLMALSAFENRAQAEERFNAVRPIEPYDPLLAVIGKGETPPKSRAPKQAERPASHARW